MTIPVRGDDACLVEALEESERKYRFLAETIPVHVWTALPDGRLDYVSLQTARSFGLEPEQLLADGWQAVLHPADLPLAVERWTQALTTGSTYEVEFRLKTRDGEYAWHLARAVPERDEAGRIVRWFGTNTNIEEQRAHQRHVEALLAEGEAKSALLREQNQLLALEAEVQAILTGGDSLADALRACADAAVRRLDAAFVRIWTADEAGMQLTLRASAGLYTHLDGPHGRVPLGHLKIGQIAAERRPHLTNRVIGDSRVTDQAWAIREGMVAFAGWPILLGEKLLGVVAAFARHPLTETSLTALGAVASALAQSLERRAAEEKIAVAKDDFLATASHELRTPLNAILGWARLMRSGNLEHSAFLRGLEVIERNAWAQVQLIDDILDGSRVVSGKLRLEVRALDLTSVVHAALDTVRSSAAAKGITIDTRLDPDAAHVHGDPDRMQQIVWNLVNNAIKFTPKGGDIDVRLERVGSSIDLTVSDSGQGISSDFLPFVFDRFRQADPTTSRRHGGLGLGLALVRHLVEAHGGTVRAESAGTGLGAKFTVSLPVMAVFADTTAPLARQTPSGPLRAGAVPQGSLRGIEVLVVDDEPDARDLVATVLRAREAEVVVAASAERAVEILHQRSPMVLISDIGMPVTDGYAFLGAVRGLVVAARGIPAIALTAYAREEDRRRALEAGFQGYLSKPVDPDALVQLVAEAARGGMRVLS